MSDPETFLSRWSRRKVADAKQKSEPSTAPEPPSSLSHPATNRTERTVDQGRATDPDKAIEPEFDLKSLPSIESIHAGTDVSMFLRAGVPAELARAALRRSWAADPSIRDFIGLSENSWDFTAPGSIPGFGPLSSKEANQLMARHVGRLREVAADLQEAATGFDRERLSGYGTVHSPQPPEASAVRCNAIPESAAMSARHEADCDNTVDVDQNSLQRVTNNAALRDKLADGDTKSVSTRRSHGRALPTLPE